MEEQRNPSGLGCFRTLSEASGVFVQSQEQSPHFCHYTVTFALIDFSGMAAALFEQF